MRTAAAILVTFIVGIGVGNWMTATPQTAPAQAAALDWRLCRRAGRDRQPGSHGPLRGRQGLAEGHQHAARQREMDLRRGTRRVCREPESHLHAVPRRAAEDGRRRRRRCCRSSGPSISFPVAGLWRDATTASLPGVGGTDQDTQEVADGLGRQRRHHRDQGPAVPHARRRREMGALHRRRRRQRQHHRDVDAVGQAAAAPALGLHQPVRSREARVGRRRQHAGDLQVHQRRQAAGADDRHAGESRAPMRRTSTGRRSSTGCPTARSSSPTATPARASRSSTRTESS